MEREIFSSKEVLDFLREIKSKYKTGGIWVSRKLGRRWSFLLGFEPEQTSPPYFLEIDSNFALFCENEKLLKEAWDSIKVRLKEMLHEGRT
ncbi:MAG: hypothetical protein QMD82_01025 [bacterium]|nr:hypothetical protein [bacterium]